MVPAPSSTEVNAGVGRVNNSSMAVRCRPLRKVSGVQMGTPGVDRAGLERVGWTMALDLEGAARW